MADNQDQLSAEDLEALKIVQSQFETTGDPRAAKIKAFIAAQPKAGPPSLPQRAATGIVGNALELANFGNNALLGAGSGALSTIYHGGDLIRRGLGMERVINRPEVQKGIAPKLGPGGGTGRFIEQAAEFAIPMGGAMKVLKGAPAMARVATDALLSGAITGVQTGGDPGAMATSAALAGGVAGVGAVLPKAAGALRESAAKGYGQALAATKQGNKWLSKNKVVPELLKRRISAWTIKGLQSEAGRQLAKVGDAIGDEWSSLPTGTAVDLDTITSKLFKASDEALSIPTARGPVPMGPVAEGGMKTANDLAATLKAVAEQNPITGKLEVPVDRLRALRQFWDALAAKAGRYQGTALADQSAAETHGMAADAIREELGKQFPNIAKLNKEYSFWKNVNQVVSDTIMRRQGQAKPLGQKMMRAAGGAAGMASGGVHGMALGAAAGDALEQLTTSPAWRTIGAVWKNDLAQALASGQGAKVEWLIQRALKPGAAATPSVLSGPTAAHALVPVP